MQHVTEPSKLYVTEASKQYVTELSKLKGKVYVHLKNDLVARKFLQDAENEGFTFADGATPTSRPAGDLYVIGRDWTISHAGWAGHVAFKNAKKIGDQDLVKVDYEEYLFTYPNLHLL